MGSGEREAIPFPFLSKDSTISLFEIQLCLS
nr:MAG TPA: hypothetical protein [Caudoviricetes sp.]